MELIIIAMLISKGMIQASIRYCTSGTARAVDPSPLLVESDRNPYSHQFAIPHRDPIRDSAQSARCAASVGDELLPHINADGVAV